MSFINIELDSEINTYAPGETIYGKVVVYKKRRPKKVKCIMVRFEGGAVVSIINHLEEQPVTSIERCLNTSISVCGEENATVNNIRIRPGRNEYIFEYILPRHLPATYSGKYGSVSYHIRANILKSNKIYVTAKVPLIINGVLDLNNEPLARKSAEVRRENKLWSMCMCHHGKVKLYFSIPKQGFVANEVVPFLVEISNFTFNHMRMVRMSLIQVIFYTIDGKRRKTQTKILLDAKCPEISPGKVHVWKGEDDDAIKIPDPILPTKLGTCSIIQIHYQLQIKVKESNLKSNRDNAVVEAFLPIIIGTVPLEDILVPTSRPSPSPPPSPYADFAYVDDDIVEEEKSMVNKSNLSSIDKFPPSYHEITQEYFI